MKNDIYQDDAGSSGTRGIKKIWIGSGIALSAIALAAGLAVYSGDSPANTSPPPPPNVTVATPSQRDLAPQLGFLGQFSAVSSVEIRAQVGGILTQIGFKDGSVVKKGELLFVVDPTPYEIRLSQANAQLETARARLELASRELQRAETLKRDDAGSGQNVDQRAAEKREAQAAVDAAQALIRDARFDLDRTRITAPFTGRIGTHLVSAGNLVSGSRAGGAQTTLLTTLVSLDQVYLNFDMSEADYMAFMRERTSQKGELADKVEIALSDEKNYGRQGTLNFIDNALDRSSGTIHARATVPNPDLMLTPGAFARVRLALSDAKPTLLVPDASVLADQSNHIVLTVGPDNTVTPKQVQIGEMRDGLRVIQSGLKPTDRVVTAGIPLAVPGQKVTPQNAPIQTVANLR
ncbi:efflux RND transporter periplasmic adaptor subunit [Duganella sp. Dugasp56]|jgi:RND family efflux transporter MFP subunit|uniref:efflux RND transporter periplasmic adaptor subunit n=1 Tax=unclassified Duganella TaxID=2636909 RepID=UPI00159D0BB4